MVITDHLEVNKIADKAMSKVRSARSRINRQAEGTRAVLDKWNDYKERYHSACRSLQDKIERQDRIDREKELKHEAFLEAHSHHRHVTKSYLAKRKNKYVYPKPVEPSVPSLNISRL